MGDLPLAECGGIFTQWDPYSAADMQKLKGRESLADFIWNAGTSCFEVWEEDSIIIFLSPGKSLLSIKSSWPPAVLQQKWFLPPVPTTDLVAVTVSLSMSLPLAHHCASSAGTLCYHHQKRVALSPPSGLSCLSTSYFIMSCLSSPFLVGRIHNSLIRSGITPLTYQHFPCPKTFLRHMYS